ncbi:MAG: lysophospholipase [Lachnospiraceae bacterium]|nr:lysophospholipase [Lachnospiraceae bacterium]
MNITTKQFSFVSKYDNVPIHGTCLIPENPIGIFQMVHGMSEHKGRYMFFMRWMAEHGMITLMHDNRGHGLSVKDDADIGYCYDSMDKGFVEDIYRVTKNIRKEYPELPLILYGHSMGSLAVRAYLREHDDAIDALIVSGCPAYNTGVPAGKLIVKATMASLGGHYRSKFMQNLVLGGFERQFAYENREDAWLVAKQSPDIEAEFGDNPICDFIYTLNGIMSLLNLESQTYTAPKYQVRNEQLPIYFVSGADDPCYINSERWGHAIDRLKNMGYQQVSSKLFAGMRHEIHNEEDYKSVYNDILYFCKSVIND